MGPAEPRVRALAARAAFKPLPELNPCSLMEFYLAWSPCVTQVR